MPANGQENLTDSDKVSVPANDGKSMRTSVDLKPTNVKGTPRRRRRDRPETAGLGAEERFFLAGADGDGSVPSLGREFPNEADAVIESFRAKLTFYRVSEFQTRAEIGRSGEPILRKEIMKRHNPAS